MSRASHGPKNAMNRRRLLAALGLSGLGASTSAQTGWLAQVGQALKGKPMNAYATEVMKWEVSFCSYGLDIDPKAQGDLETLWSDNWFKDAEGNVVVKFFTGFGAAWGAGASGMGGSNPKGSRLPKTFRLTYYDFLEDRFYQLDGDLPQQRIYELFQRKIVDKDVNYGKVRGRFDDLRLGVAPRGNVMLWAAGLGNQVELQAYRAHELQGMTRASYNASLPGGTFTLMEDRWKALAGGRLQADTLDRIKAGWVPDPAWYMRTIRVKYPWRHRLTGNVSQMTELESYQGNAESQTVGAWEVMLYQNTTAMRGIPKTAKFWFTDKAGTRHHLWLSFSLRERALSEKDLTEVRAAFEQMFPGRKLEDNDYLPNEHDMATVEVHVSDDCKAFTASLVKGDRRVPLPVGKTQHYELEPYTHWLGNKSGEITPEERRLFLLGPDT